MDASVKPSGLLSPAENSAICRMIGAKIQSVATTVVQLYQVQPRKQHWDYLLTGVACLAKDFNRRSYFIQIFDMDKQKLAWEQEIYNEFKFKMPKLNVAVFEADTVMAALLFADSREASDFDKAIQLRLSKLQRTVVTQPSGTITII